MKLTRKPANRNGEIASKCHWHRGRMAVACGAKTRRGYCRACHTQAMRPAPFDAAIWLAALVALALALVGGVGCGGQDFTSMGGTRPTEDAGAEGSIGSATGAGGSSGSGGSRSAGGSLGGSGGSPGGSGGRAEGSGGSLGGSGGSLGGSGGTPGGSGGSGGSTITPEDSGAPEAAAGGAPGAGGSTGSGGSTTSAGGSTVGSGGASMGGAIGSGGAAVCIQAECPTCTISTCCYSLEKCGCWAPASGCYPGHI